MERTGTSRSCLSVSDVDSPGERLIPRRERFESSGERGIPHSFRRIPHGERAKVPGECDAQPFNRAFPLGKGAFPSLRRFADQGTSHSPGGMGAKRRGMSRSKLFDRIPHGERALMEREWSIPSPPSSFGIRDQQRLA